MQWHWNSSQASHGAALNVMYDWVGSGYEQKNGYQYWIDIPNVLSTVSLEEGIAQPFTLSAAAILKFILESSKAEDKQAMKSLPLPYVP